jgi:hypothetical protein
LKNPPEISPRFPREIGLASSREEWKLKTLQTLDFSKKNKKDGKINTTIFSELLLIVELAIALKSWILAKTILKPIFGSNYYSN